MKLRDLKESYPVELVFYAERNVIIKEPAFHLWATYVLRKRKRIISKMKSNLQKREMKFGTLLPTTVEEALELDEKNGN